MNDIHGIKIWSSMAVQPGNILTIADLTKFQDAVLHGGRVSPSVAVMAPATFDRFKDVLHTENVRRFLGIVGPFAPITIKSVWRSVADKMGTALYRLRKAYRVLRHGYDPEDM